MRLTMILLCLIAALAGTPLRQSEAAGDFARARQEIVEGDTLASIDGGVGDDSGETILKPSSLLVVPSMIQWDEAPRGQVARTAFSARKTVARPPESRAHRQSRLQCFLF